MNESVVIAIVKRGNVQRTGYYSAETTDMLIF